MVQREAILKGNITGVFFRYVTPGVIGMVGMSLYILADTYFIANGVGRLGLAALNIGLPAYNLIFGIGALLGIGGGTVFSILHGRGELGRANRPFTISAVLGTAFSLLFALLGLVAAEPIAFLLGATEETALYTTTYLRVILLFSPAFILNNIMTAFVRNDGNPHLAMAAMTISTLTNIVLDYVCIYPLKLGMFGAALATGLGSVLGLLIQLTHFLRRGNSLRLQRIRPTVRETLQIMRCGISNFITEFSAGIVILAFNAVILRLAGNTGVAAYGIAANIAIVCTAFFNGIGQGVQPIISTNYGALQMGRVWRAFLLAAACAGVIGLLFYGAGMLFPTQIAGLFNQEKSPELTALAVRAFHLFFLAFALMGFNIITITTLSAMAQLKEAFALSILRGVAVILPVLFLLSYFFGLDGVWLTIPVTELLIALLGVILLLRARWKLKKAHENDQTAA